MAKRNKYVVKRESKRKNYGREKGTVVLRRAMSRDIVLKWRSIGSVSDRSRQYPGGSSQRVPDQWEFLSFRLTGTIDYTLFFLI